MEVLSCDLTGIPTWMIWIAIIVIALLWYMRHIYTYWKRAGLPYALYPPFSKSAREMNKKPLHEIELKMYKDHGRIYGYYEGMTPNITIAEPDIMKNILVKDFHIFTSRRTIGAGDRILELMLSNLQAKDWKRVRTIVSPAFSTGKIKKMTSIFIDSAKTLTDNFKKAAKEGKSVDVECIFGAFTMDVITSSAFGTKIDSHNDPENPFVTSAKNLFTQTNTWRLFMAFFFPAFARFFKISIFYPGTMEFFEKATLEIVEERKRSKQRRNDFLQLMIDAVEKGMIEAEEEDSFTNNEVEQVTHVEGKGQMTRQNLNLKTLSNAELVSQCVTFFIGGYSTIMSTLTFTAYELALNADIQDKLIEEIDAAIGEKKELDYEAVSKMKYLDNVVSETLRKYPPAIRTERKADEDYHIEEHNITVPKGMLVGIPVYAIHHDPEHYPDPEKYDPDRFSQEEKSSRHPYTYLPFGSGPRNCVAMRFALMEIKVCLAYVLSQCRFCTCDETMIPLEFIRNFLQMQPKKVALKIEIRSGNMNL